MENESLRHPSLVVKKPKELERTFSFTLIDVGIFPIRLGKNCPNHDRVPLTGGPQTWWRRKSEPHDPPGDFAVSWRAFFHSAFAKACPGAARDLAHRPIATASHRRRCGNHCDGMCRTVLPTGSRHWEILDISH